MRSRCSSPAAAWWIFAALLLGACGADTLEQEYKRKLVLPSDLRTLQVRVPLGEVQVDTHEGGRFLAIEGHLRRTAADPDDLDRLAAVPFEPELTPTEVPGIYAFVVPGLPAGVDPIRSALIFRCSLSLPAEIAIDVETGAGDLGVENRRAAVRLSTGLGEVAARAVEGFADLATGNGKITVLDHRGGLRAQSGDPERPKLTGETIWAKVLELGPEGIDLRSNGTSLDLFLPAAARFTLDAEVELSQRGKSGIRNGFGVPVTPVGGGDRAVGSVGGGGPPVVLRLGKGWVTVDHLQRRS